MHGATSRTLRACGSYSLSLTGWVLVILQMPFALVSDLLSWIGRAVSNAAGSLLSRSAINWRICLALTLNTLFWAVVIIGFRWEVVR